MKKYMIFIALMLVYMSLHDYIKYYNGDFYIKKSEVVNLTKNDEENIYVRNEEDFKEIEIKGVNIGFGKPGEYKTSFSITKEEYLRWFEQIVELGANTIRVYELMDSAFYDAFYEFNIKKESKLYLIHGVGVDDYVLKSEKSALDSDFRKEFENNCKDVVDAVNGRLKSDKIIANKTQYYQNNISDFVIGYVIGVDWNADFVAFTNRTESKINQYSGKFLETENASNFEIILAEIADKMISYESEKYGKQRLIAFSNWRALLPTDIEQSFEEYSKINIENIKFNENFLGGSFIAYNFNSKTEECLNNEYNYENILQKINEFHTYPVVITEFGLPSGRIMTEIEQGKELVEIYNRIENSGCKGAILSTWQDEWYKREWNTMAGVDLKFDAYWHDGLTNNQHYGIMSFDLIEKNWSQSNYIGNTDGYDIYMKQSESYLELKIEKKDIENFNIAIDITEKSGSNYSENLGITMSEKADFIIEVGVESRVWVHERYNQTKALFSDKIMQFINPPEKNSDKFEVIERAIEEKENENYEVGKLTENEVIFGENHVEVKIPWGLLNFSDPLNLRIHDDYYEKMGVENLQIKSIKIGVGQDMIEMIDCQLKRVARNVDYDERLKESYHILQERWIK